MQSQALTVVFQGVDAPLVEVQCAMAPGLPAFTVVGLADKAVSEARERVRSALAGLSIALPSRRITINLAPADMPKEGSHFDLPIALALLCAIGILPPEAAQETLAIGELTLDGRLVAVQGALPAAVTAASEGRALLCPRACAREAAWVGDAHVIGAASLGEVIAHFTGRSVIAPATPGEVANDVALRDFADVKGQDLPRRALEIAAAGRHHMLMTGPPGAGKSMLAARLPSILPPLTPHEALETSMVHSVSGLISAGGLSRSRPFRAPHHSASVAALVGGGRRARPGEISLAHNGVLFLDELPEFGRQVLDTLRQPLETGEVLISRASARIRYPCRFMLLAAANPCRCGHMLDANRACGRAPVCGADYMAKISGPLMDRFDLRIDVEPVPVLDLQRCEAGEASLAIAERVAAARDIQIRRFRDQPLVQLNADAEGQLLEEIAPLDQASREMMAQATARFGLSARGYHRVQRVARTIADLDAAQHITRTHVAEALSYRLQI